MMLMRILYQLKLIKIKAKVNLSQLSKIESVHLVI